MSDNKPTKVKLSNFTKKSIQTILDNYANAGQFWEDLEGLSPVQRMAMIEKFTNYILPKMQATTMDMTMQKEKSIEDKLRDLCQDPNITDDDITTNDNEEYNNSYNELSDEPTE